MIGFYGDLFFFLKLRNGIMAKNILRKKAAIWLKFIRQQTYIRRVFRWLSRGFSCMIIGSNFKPYLKGSCDDELFESKIRCLNGYFICKSDRVIYRENRLIGSQLQGSIGVRYLPLNRSKTVCPTGLDSPVNLYEAQSLGLKPGIGNILTNLVTSWPTYEPPTRSKT